MAIPYKVCEINHIPPSGPIEFYGSILWLDKPINYVNILNESSYPSAEVMDLSFQAQIEAVLNLTWVRDFSSGWLKNLFFNGTQIINGVEYPEARYTFVKNDATESFVVIFSPFATNIKRKQSYRIAKKDSSSLPLCTYPETGYTKIKSFRRFIP